MNKISYCLYVIIVVTVCLTGCKENESRSTSNSKEQEEIASLRVELEETKKQIQQLRNQVSDLDKSIEENNSNDDKEHIYMDINDLRMHVNELSTIVHNIPDLIMKDVYIRKASEEEQVLVVDEMEWISEENRMVELGIDPDDMSPNGFYIYNPSEEQVTLPVGSLFFCHVLRNGYESQHVGMGLYEIEEDIREFYPFRLYIMNGEIIGITQYYIP